jgi:MFS superfamily sulfate permease-like transporter
VWALMVPEALAYAGIAGVPVQYGLYAVPLALCSATPSSVAAASWSSAPVPRW